MQKKVADNLFKKGSIMIRVDLHTHTDHSHGKDSVATMFAQAKKKKLEILGYSEHSPRPEAYTYCHEYREHLVSTFGEYINSVQELKKNKQGVTVLLGLELDYLPNEKEFMSQAKSSWPFDYVIGGIHFLDKWGFDGNVNDWAQLSVEESFACYEQYFRTVRLLAESGMADILAHPDIIKIFTVHRFHIWLGQTGSLDLVRDSFEALKKNGMAMEISSAGLRKPCKEIYPGPEIMSIAADIGLPITFGSDAHSADTLAWGFDKLAEYARTYGYKCSVFFQNGTMHEREF